MASAADASNIPSCYLTNPKIPVHLLMQPIIGFGHTWCWIVSPLKTAEEGGTHPLLQVVLRIMAAVASLILLAVGLALFVPAAIIKTIAYGCFSHDEEKGQVPPSGAPPALKQAPLPQDVGSASAVVAPPPLPPVVIAAPHPAAVASVHQHDGQVVKREPEDRLASIDLNGVLAQLQDRRDDQFEVTLSMDFQRRLGLPVKQDEVVLFQVVRGLHPQHGNGVCLFISVPRIKFECRAFKFQREKEAPRCWQQIIFCGVIGSPDEIQANYFAAYLTELFMGRGIERLGGSSLKVPLLPMGNLPLLSPQQPPLPLPRAISFVDEDADIERADQFHAKHARRAAVHSWKKNVEGKKAVQVKLAQLEKSADHFQARHRLQSALKGLRLEKTKRESLKRVRDLLIRNHQHQAFQHWYEQSPLESLTHLLASPGDIDQARFCRLFFQLSDGEKVQFLQNIRQRHDQRLPALLGSLLRSLFLSPDFNPQNPIVEPLLSTRPPAALADLLLEENFALNPKVLQALFGNRLLVRGSDILGELLKKVSADGTLPPKISNLIVEAVRLDSILGWEALKNLDPTRERDLVIEIMSQLKGEGTFANLFRSRQEQQATLLRHPFASIILLAQKMEPNDLGIFLTFLTQIKVDNATRDVLRRILPMPLVNELTSPQVLRGIPDERRELRMALLNLLNSDVLKAHLKERGYIEFTYEILSVLQMQLPPADFISLINELFIQSHDAWDASRASQIPYMLHFLVYFPDQLVEAVKQYQPRCEALCYPKFLYHLFNFMKPEFKSDFLMRLQGRPRLLFMQRILIANNFMMESKNVRNSEEIERNNNNIANGFARYPIALAILAKINNQPMELIKKAISMMTPLEKSQYGEMERSQIDQSDKVQLESLLQANDRGAKVLEEKKERAQRVADETRQRAEAARAKREEMERQKANEPHPVVMIDPRQHEVRAKAAQEKELRRQQVREKQARLLARHLAERSSRG